MSSLKKFISHWYFRYLLVTELYMVESWERTMIYIAFLLFLIVLSLFNSCIVLSGMDYILYQNLNPPIQLPMESQPQII